MTNVIVADESLLEAVFERLFKKHVSRHIVEDEKLELATVADELNISERTVRRLLKSGQLRGRKVGNHWVVMRSAIEAYERAE